MSLLENRRTHATQVVLRRRTGSFHPHSGAFCRDCGFHACGRTAAAVLERNIQRIALAGGTLARRNQERAETRGGDVRQSGPLTQKESLHTENKMLRESAETFGELAERLNTALKEQGDA